MYRYVAYDFAVESEIELPELVPAPATTTFREPALRVRLGGVPARMEAPDVSRVTWDARPDAWLHEIVGVARFYVHDGGREVRIEPTGGTLADVRALLFASPLGAILHQRGRFALHAGALAMPAGAVAVAGHSGAGKSTTLAELIRRGHPVLSDDKTVVRFGDGGPEVIPGYPTLRLWRDAAERMGEDVAALPVLRAGLEKYLYRADRFETAPTPLRLIVMLSVHHEAGPGEGDDGLRTEWYGPHDAIGAVLHQTYRRGIVDGSGKKAEHFGWAARLAGAVPVVRVVRHGRRDSVTAVADRVEALLAEAVGEAAAAPSAAAGVAPA